MKENKAPETQKPQGLSKTLKYFFGVGDAGFTLMSNIETFYFMNFLTNIAAGKHNGIENIYNLNGVRISAAKGLCIKNGKKVFVK